MKMTSRRSRIALRLAAASVIAFVPAGASLADPPGTLNDIGRHQHYLETANGKLVPIGPDFCANPDLQDAFNQFHYNIHHNSGAPTLGPQDGAPGLHDEVAADLAITLCPAE
jgi:hypothetical protein